MIPKLTKLATKDGRKLGNALVLNHDDKYNVVKSDYGNVMKFTDEEINAFFYLDGLADETHKYHPNHEPSVVDEKDLNSSMLLYEAGEYWKEKRLSEPEQFIVHLNKIVDKAKNSIPVLNVSAQA